MMDQTLISALVCARDLTTAGMMATMTMGIRRDEQCVRPTLSEFMKHALEILALYRAKRSLCTELAGGLERFIAALDGRFETGLRARVYSCVHIQLALSNWLWPLRFWRLSIPILKLAYRNFYLQPQPTSST